MEGRRKHSEEAIFAPEQRSLLPLWLLNFAWISSSSLLSSIVKAMYGSFSFMSRLLNRSRLFIDLTYIDKVVKIIDNLLNIEIKKKE